MSPCSLAESYFSHNESLGRIFIESEGRLSIRKSSWSAGIIPSVFAFPMALMCGPEVAVFHSSIEISRQRAPNQLFGCRPGHVTWNCSPLSILQRLKFESRTSCCGRVCVCVWPAAWHTHRAGVSDINKRVPDSLCPSGGHWKSRHNWIDSFGRCGNFPLFKMNEAPSKIVFSLV